MNTKIDEPVMDIFPTGVLGVLAGISGKTPEEEAIDLLEQEKEVMDNEC